MGTKFLKVVCDEHSIGGGGEYCGGNDAGKGAPRAVLFDYEPGVIDAVSLRRCSASSSARAAT
jgi:hypothetical protein